MPLYTQAEEMWTYMIDLFAYIFAKLLHNPLCFKKKSAWKKMKVNTHVAFLLVCASTAFMFVKIATSSPVPDASREQTMRAKQKPVAAVEKCPTLTYCTCKERKVDLDITCSGVNTQKLKVGKNTFSKTIHLSLRIQPK